MERVTETQTGGEICLTRRYIAIGLDCLPLLSYAFVQLFCRHSQFLQYSVCLNELWTEKVILYLRNSENN